uniref:Uncharacterized protein n=1 Tax=Tetranychus urticae TaxID=32264 RepID=T1KTZ3_TETUR
MLAGLSSMRSNRNSKTNSKKGADNAIYGQLTISTALCDHVFNISFLSRFG